MSVFRGSFKYLVAFFLVLIGLLCISTLAQAATYYVAKSGNDSNPGTETKPWLTIQKAADTMVAGDIVYVKEGNYSQKLIIRTFGTSFDNMVSYLAYPGDTPIIDGQIYFSEGASYNKFNGFKIIGNQSFANINMEASNADHNIISNCVIEGDGNGGGGIGYSGIGNIFEGNNISKGGHGFHPGGGDVDGTIIKNNIIHDMIGHGVAAVGGKNEKVIGNIVYNCRKGTNVGGTGIFFGTQSPENVWVEGNIVYGNEIGEITVEGPNATVINNTAVTMNPGVSKTYILLGSNLTVKNNIGYRTGDGKQVVLLPKDAITDYNCWFNPEEPKCISRYYDSMTLPQYQAYGQGAHSISQDPLFVNMANHDFHLQPDSPCIGAGENGVEMGAYGAGESLPVYDDPAEPDSASENPPETESQSDDGDGVHNRPNPFRAGKEETLIEYDLEEPSNVIITIYDLLGQEVWQENYRSGGNGGKEDNSVPWDGRNLSGKVVANGGYICRIWVEKEKRHMLRKIAVAK